MAVPAARAAAPPGRIARLGVRLFARVDISSVACFRIAFGLLMVWEVVRYFQHGWITDYYVRPAFHFKYYGFGWVEAWPGTGMYIHFAALGVLALCMAVGLWYRAASTLFFTGFTYVFLLDQARYLNHFYLIVLLSGLMAVVPAHRAWSLDAWRRPDQARTSAPVWSLWLLRAQVGIPYFYAGLAKLNADWLHGEPLRAWLADRADLAFIGPLLTREPVVWLFVYGGLAFDLLVVPLLLWRRSRPLAFVAAVAFHGLNAALFRIGVFPWVMIAATTLFLPPDWPRRVLPSLASRDGMGPAAPALTPRRRAGLVLIALYLAVQLVVPLRHLAYPGDVNWTEEGHRFSWHMKLRDKDARAAFDVTDREEGRTWRVDPLQYLARRQAEAMASRPDMILLFAHHLAGDARHEGHARVEVRALAMASLNGRRAQFLVDPSVDLAAEPRSLRPGRWILPLAEPLPKRQPRTPQGSDLSMERK